MEEGQGARKSNKMSEKECTRKSEEITSTPARVVKGTGAVTPGNQPINEREQQSSKKKREDQKRTTDQYFGGGERVQPPSKGGTPVQSILLRRPTKTPERARKTDNTVETQLTPERLDNAEEGAVMNANMVVNLEGFTTGLRPKETDPRRETKGERRRGRQKNRLTRQKHGSQRLHSGRQK